SSPRVLTDVERGGCEQVCLVSFPLVWLVRARRIVLVEFRNRSGPSMAEQRQYLVADPLWRWYAPRSKRVGPGDFDIVRRHGDRRHLPLGRSHEANSQRLRQIADAREEPRSMKRAVELKTGEVVVVYPFVEQRLDKHLGCKHLLTA